MALPPPQESAPERSSRDLPATYRNPWQSLGENLQAVVADTGLRGREFWRRNAQGMLWRPSWWPADLAPLFWPLLLALATALLVALISVGWMALRLRSGVAPLESSNLPISASAEVATSLQPPGEPLPQAPSPSVPGDSAPGEITAAPATTDPEPSVAEQELEPDAPEAVLPPEPTPVAPLDALLQRPQAEGLLVGARVLPDQVSLVLEVAPGFANLSTAERQRRAEQWQEWATELGYHHLELRDSRSGLLARDALVGSGMIVLSEQPQP
jgi:hypothetical protein